jgi:tetratricopeptide (TPR) repeat protein
MQSRAGLAAAQIRAGDTATGEADCQKLLTDYAGKAELPEAILKVAQGYQKANLPDQAGVLYQYVLSNFQDNGDAVLKSRIGQVQVHIAQAQETTAETAITQLSSQYQGHPGLRKALFFVYHEYYDQGMLLRKNGDEAGARPFFEKAIAGWQKSLIDTVGVNYTPETYHMVAGTYRIIKEYKPAIENYQVLVKGWPNHELAWTSQHMIGYCYEQMLRAGQISREEAKPLIRQAYETLLDKYPHCPAARAAGSWLKRNSG